MVLKGQRETKSTQSLFLDFGDQPVAKPEHGQEQGTWKVTKVGQEEELGWRLSLPGQHEEWHH